jgi:anti-anti-sigma factor
VTALLDLRTEGSTVTVTGEVDHSTCDELRAVLDPVVAKGAAVVVDLRAVTFMDSPGISTLVTARRVAEEHGGTLTVLASEPVDRALTVMALETMLGIAPEEA